MPVLAKPKVTLDNVAEAFKYHGYLVEVPPAELGWLGQKFRVSKRRDGNQNGVIALELWWGRDGRYGWAMYISAAGLENSNTLAHLRAKGILNKYLDGKRLATCFELARIETGAHATHAEVMAAANRASSLASGLL